MSGRITSKLVLITGEVSLLCLYQRAYLIKFDFYYLPSSKFDYGLKNIVQEYKCTGYWEVPKV